MPFDHLRNPQTLDDVGADAENVHETQVLQESPRGSSC
jgi:hypothetical protein